MGWIKEILTRLGIIKCKHPEAHRTFRSKVSEKITLYYCRICKENVLLETTINFTGHKDKEEK